MMKTRRFTTSWHLTGVVYLTAVLFLAVAFAAAGCGSSSTSSSSASVTPSSTPSGVAQAASAVATAEAPVDFTFDTPLGVQPKSGQTAAYISVLLGIPFSQEQVAGFKEAMAAVGNKTIVTDANGSTDAAARQIEQAINQKVDVIILQSLSSDRLAQPLLAAQKAGIPVIQLYEVNPQLPTPAQQKLGVYGNVSFDFAKAGELQASWVIADSGGQGHGIIIQAPDSGTAKPQVDALTTTFSSLAPDFKIEVKDALQGEWPIKIPSITQAALRDPSINYILPIYDGMATYVVPEVHKANAQDRVKVSSINADIPQMQQLAAGDVIGALVGQPLNWLGWAIADQSLRAMNGVPAVADELVPQRVFTKNNIGEVDIKGAQASWFGTTDYKAAYKALWGVQ
jgi:ribose transport system substrate-binding protein